MLQPLHSCRDACGGKRYASKIRVILAVPLCTAVTKCLLRPCLPSCCVAELAIGAGVH